MKRSQKRSVMGKALVTALSFVTAASLSFPLSVNLSSEAFLRYTTTYRASDAYNTVNAFSVERGYLTVEPIFNENLKGRVTLDITLPLASAALPVSYIKLKYAYLSIDNMIPSSSLMVGVINHFMGTVYDWKYQFIDKALVDKYGFVKSADTGIAFTGKAFEKMFEYGIWVVNGEGYDIFGTSLDRVPEVGANIRVSPIDMLTAGISFAFTPTGSPSMYNMSDRLSRYVYSANIKFATGPVTVLAEYAGAQFPKTAPGYTTTTVARDVVSSAATGPASDIYIQNAGRGSVFFELGKVMETVDLDVGLLCDFFDREFAATNDLRIDGGLNINYNLARDEKKNPMVVAQLAYTMSFAQMASSIMAISSHTVQAQIKMKFGTTIK